MSTYFKAVFANICFKVDEAEKFVLPQCSILKIPFIIFKILAAICFLAFAIAKSLMIPWFKGYTCKEWSTAKKETCVQFMEHYWLAYLTNWALLLLIIYLLLSAINVIYFHFMCSNFESKSAKLTEPSRLQLFILRAQWMFGALALPIGLGITVLYFALDYPHVSKPISGFSIVSHVINSVVIVVDVLISGYSVYMIQFLYTVVFVATYVVWSVIYWEIDHRNVMYVPLNWNKVQTAALTSVLSIIILPIVCQFLVWCIYKLRAMAYKCVKPDAETAALLPTHHKEEDTPSNTN